MERQLTKSAYWKLKGELRRRRTTDRKKIAGQIREAKEFGDLSENAAYKEAQEAELNNESRIAQLKSILREAVILDEKEIGNDNIQIGNSLEVKIEGKKVVYHIVDSSEIDPNKRKISPKSPLGELFMGHKAGDKLDFAAPDGVRRIYNILRVF